MSQAAIHQTGFRNLNRPDHSDFGPIPRAAWIEHRVPNKPMAGCCPHCMQGLQDGPQTTIHRIRWAVVQLFSAVVAIVFCALRLARLAVAVAFSLVGVVGFGMQTLGTKVAHPDDRRLLPRLGNYR